MFLQPSSNYSIYISSLEIENNKGDNLLIVNPYTLEDLQCLEDLFNLENCKVKVVEESGKLGWEINPNLDNNMIEFKIQSNQEITNFIQENQLIIELLDQQNENFKVWFDCLGKLVPIGEIVSDNTKKWLKHKFTLDIIGNLDYLKTENNWKIKSIVSYKNPDPRIEKVRFLNKSNEPVVGIEEGEKLTIEINYYSSLEIKYPIFAMTIYTLDGLNICHANTVLGNLEIDKIYGSGKVCFVFDPFYGGAGEYMLSSSIFENLDPSQGVQPKFYDQHDRAYRFRVWKKLGIALNLGLVRLPYHIQHHPHEQVIRNISIN